MLISLKSSRGQCDPPTERYSLLTVWWISEKARRFSHKVGKTHSDTKKTQKVGIKKKQARKSDGTYVVLVRHYPLQEMADHLSYKSRKKGLLGTPTVH